MAIKGKTYPIFWARYLAAYKPDELEEFKDKLYKQWLMLLVLLMKM